MVRVLEDIPFKFLNRRTWREVASDLQVSAGLPQFVEALREGARRLHTPESESQPVEVAAR